MEKTFKNINDIHEWEHNPRSIDVKSFDRLKKQVEMLGQYKPLLVTSRGTVIGGNMRIKALRELGYTDVWVSMVDFIMKPDGLWYAMVNGKEAKKRFASEQDGMMEFALSDNDEAGYTDADKLANLLSEFNVDWADYATNFDALKTVGSFLDSVAPDVQEDEAPAVDEVNPPVSILGEVYQLGNHRLMCGDSTKIEDMDKLLNGVQPTMIFTDPPYGVDYQSRVDEERRKGWGAIENDDLKGEKLQQFLKDTVGIYGQTRYVCCNWQSVVDFFVALGKPNAFIIWDKGSIGLGAGYRNQHEIILFYGKLDHNKESNVWNIKRDSTSGYTHPTQKPVAIPARGITNSSNKGDVVLDMFGGSGSTLMAAEQLDRVAYTMELDPKYCDVIRKRYSKYLGDEAGWEGKTPALNADLPQNDQSPPLRELAQPTPTEGTAPAVE